MCTRGLEIVGTLRSTNIDIYNIDIQDFRFLHPRADMEDHSIIPPKFRVAKADITIDAGYRALILCEELEPILEEALSLYLSRQGQGC